MKLSNVVCRTARTPCPITYVCCSSDGDGRRKLGYALQDAKKYKLNSKSYYATFRLHDSNPNVARIMAGYCLKLWTVLTEIISGTCTLLG